MGGALLRRQAKSLPGKHWVTLTARQQGFILQYQVCTRRGQRHKITKLTMAAQHESQCQEQSMRRGEVGWRPIQPDAKALARPVAQSNASEVPSLLILRCRS